MERAKSSEIIQYGVPVILIGLASLAFIVHGKGYDLSLSGLATLFEKPCETPVSYRLGTYDARFGISKSEFETLVGKAAALWNEEAGRTLVVRDDTNGFPVNLVYSEHQEAANLGKVIDSEQTTYEKKRAEVEAIESDYRTLHARFESANAAYEKRAREYDQTVAKWNAAGGAPPAEYDRLQEEQRSLKREGARIEALAGEVNALVDKLNQAVTELNQVAAETNAKVNTYNAAVGHDFDQGNYIEDEEGTRINIFEFTNRIELSRVLAHEFGHALTLEHVENPESIMYSYNVGATFALTEEDKAELARVCSGG